MTDLSPCYIWANFDYDVLKLDSHFCKASFANDTIMRDSVRHLRILIDLDRDSYPLENTRTFPNLESCHVVAENGRGWWQMIQVLQFYYWPEMPKVNSRMVDAKTGEWLSLETCHTYTDYLDTGEVGAAGLQYWAYKLPATSMDLL